MFKRDCVIRSSQPCIFSLGILLDVMKQPGGEGSLEENGYMYMYG